MTACPLPHSSAHSTSKVPVRVGVSQKYVTEPGIMSIFARNSGT